MSHRAEAVRPADATARSPPNLDVHSDGRSILSALWVQGHRLRPGAERRVSYCTSTDPEIRKVFPY